MSGALHAQNEALPATASADEPYQGAWRLEDEAREAGLWKQLSEKEPENARAQYNWFVSTRNASLARNEGELAAADKEQLAAIASNLTKQAPNSFEANMARFHLEFPARSSFTALAAAAASDPGRPELLGPQLARAMMDGNETTIQAACRALDNRGSISQALLDVATDLLLSIDPNGIVFTNGEMDSYPTLVRQRVFGVRKDVLVIDQRMLADAAYRQSMWGRAQASGAPPVTTEAYIKSLLNATTRPVFLALSLDPAIAKGLEGELYATGIALRYSHQRVDNLGDLAARWSRMNKNLYAGPLSANYLLPGVVLLKHYRAIGEEALASRTEHEVRGMAEVLHLTVKLERLGVLEH